MNIIVNTKILTDAFAEVVPFIAKKSPIAILKYAKITTKGSRIKIEANNTQCSIRKYIDAISIDQDGSFLIDIATINAFLKKCTCNEITLVVEDETLTLRYDRGYAKYQVMNVDLYPVFDMPNDAISEFSLPSSLFKKSVILASNFVGTDDLRPTMKCIFVSVNDGKFCYCATDTRKMITSHYDVSNIDGVSTSFYIIADIFPSIINACATGIDTIDIKVSDTHVSYKIGNTIIQYLQPKGTYPDFKRVIPRQWTLECGIDKNEMLESLNRAESLCDKSRLVKINISQSDMVISADDFEEQKKACEHIQHNGSSGDITIGLNIDWLKTCISSCTSQEISLRITNAAQPVLFHQPDDDNMTILLMPMTLVN